MSTFQDDIPDDIGCARCEEYLQRMAHIRLRWDKMLQLNTESHRASLHSVALIGCLLLATATASGSPYSDLVSSHAPVAHWRLDEKAGTVATDATGIYTGTYRGPTFGQVGPGRNNPGAANFDGTNDYIEVGAPTVGTSALTIAAWIKPDDFGIPDARIFSKKKIWTLLMVVGNPAALSSQESLRVFALGDMFGFQVNLIAASASQASFDAAVAVADVAYVPEDVVASQLGTKLRNAAIGIANEDAPAVGNLGIAATGGVVTRNTLRITNNSHYITSGMALGNLVFLSSNQSITYVNPAYAAGLTQLAETTYDGINYRPSLAIMDVGASLQGGGTAAGRRLQLPWGGDAFDAAQLNAAGQNFAARGLNWVAGRTDGTAEVNRHFWTLATRVSGGKAYLSFLLKAGGSTTTLNATSGELIAGKWAFVTAVYDGSKMLLYKDGQEVASTNKTGSVDNGTSVPAWIGDNPEKSAGSASAKPFDGLIDEVAVFGKALTPAEVRGLYLVGVSRGVHVRKWEEIP